MPRTTNSDDQSDHGDRGPNVTDRPKAQVVETDSAGHTWIKSSSSGGQNTSCVEVARADGGVRIRCSRDRAGARLSLPSIADLIDWLQRGS